MKVFSFSPTSSIKKAYSGLILRYRRHDSTIEFAKVGLLAGVLCIAGFIYLYYVNLSSTRGWYLRQETQKLNNIQFNFDILRTKLLDYKQTNRDSIQGNNSKREVVNIKAEVVKIPSSTDLAYNKQ